MRALVIYESMYGNTKRVADAIADGIAPHLTVETVEVSRAPTEIPGDVDLLVVGGPTHGHGMTTVPSRTTAARSAPLVSHEIGIREWLERAHPAVDGLAAAAFDTRITGPSLLWGSAAKAFVKGLGRIGFRLIAPAHSFLVAFRGPVADLLLEGELAKARTWGADLATKVGARRGTAVT